MSNIEILISYLETFENKIEYLKKIEKTFDKETNMFKDEDGEEQYYDGDFEQDMEVVCSKANLLAEIIPQIKDC